MKWAIRVVIGLGLLCSLLTLSSLLGRWHWTLDLASHFHLQYTIGLALCLLLLVTLSPPRAASRARWWGHWEILVLLPALLINVYLLAPFFTPSPAGATAASPTLRVVSMNISTSNAGYPRVIDYIREHEPDFVFLSEVRADLVALLEAELGDEYPYRYAVPSRMTLGLAFLSRRPFVDVETVMLSERRRQFLRAVIDWQGQPVELVGIHPYPPLNAGWAASRNAELGAMAAYAQTVDTPFVLLSDTNAAPWSHAMEPLVDEAGLRYAAQGHGLRATWRLGNWLLGAPIDHVLVSPQWAVADYAAGGNIGSDHVPVLADLALK